MRNDKVIFFALVVVMTASMALAWQPATSDQMPMQHQPGHSIEPAKPVQTMQMPMQQGSQTGQMQPMDCQAMMQKMRSMQASEKAMDDRLATLVNDMNKVKGWAKVDRMAAVINEMVTQRKQMRDEMAAMMPEMMNHMMQHMQSGMMSGMQSMANCPMMSGASQPTEQPAAAEHRH